MESIFIFHGMLLVCYNFGLRQYNHIYFFYYLLLYDFNFKKLNQGDGKYVCMGPLLMRLLMHYLAHSLELFFP